MNADMNMNMYEVRVPVRKMAFSVQVLDGITGQPAAGEIQVLAEGVRQEPVRKKDGCFVFLNLESGVYMLHIVGRWYCPERITMCLEAGRREPATAIVRLAPRRSHPFYQSCPFFVQSSSPYVSAILWQRENTGLKVVAWEAQEGPEDKLVKSIVKILARQKKNLENRCLTTLDSAENPQAFWVEKRMNGAYLLDRFVAFGTQEDSPYAVPLAAVSMGQRDETGTLFVPAWTVEEDCGDLAIAFTDERGGVSQRAARLEKDRIVLVDCVDLNHVKTQKGD